MWDFKNSCEIIEIIATESHPLHEQRSMYACREARLSCSGNPVINHKGVLGQLYKDYFSLSAFSRPNLSLPVQLKASPGSILLGDTSLQRNISRYSSIFGLRLTHCVALSQPLSSELTE